MNFVLFEDAKGKIINNINWVSDKLVMPDEAIAFTYFHQKDINNIYNKRYRVGKKITTIGDLCNIDNSLVERAINFANINPSVAYSLYIENNIPYFHILDDSITLVENKNELNLTLLKEIANDLNIQNENKGKN